MSSYDKAEKAITDYFGDTTNTHEATKQGLIGLRDHIDTLLDALDADNVDQDE